VLGAHPHVLQPVTRRGRKLVAWSLGNFVFPSARPHTRSTGILLTALDARGVTGWRLVPATIHGFRPVLDAAAS
jgi:poly-gamma-glutamate capsule biosynthesis protein CapA/YwtB (metallophosphatase superfamily)